MTAFDLTLAAPLGAAFTGGLGGPGAVGHTGPDWRDSAGMDLGAAPGSEVRATFEGRVTGLVHGVGSQTRLTITDPSSRVSALYADLADVPSHLDVGTTVALGEPVGTVLAVAGTAPHLHLALCEHVAGRAVGVDLYASYLDLSLTQTTSAATFFQQEDVGPVPAGGTLGAYDPRDAWTIDVDSLIGVQRALVSLGFDPGVPGGSDGPRTRHAVQRFQAAYGLRPDGVLSPVTRGTLSSALLDAGMATVA